MASPITKETVKHLAELARLDLTSEEEDRLVKDLGNILNYFEELRALDTTGVEPVAGGSDVMNVFRADNERENTDQGAGAKDFPAGDQGYLKIPPVFE